MRDKVIGFIMALFPVLSIYVVPGLGLPMGMVVMYILVAPLLLYGINIKSNGRRNVVKIYFTFIVYAILITFLFQVFNNVVIGLILNSICILLFLMRKGYINYFLKYYCIFSALFSAFLIIQYISLWLFAKPIDGIIPFIPTVLNEATSLRASDYMTVARLSSVFLEPSHFALYVIPSLALLLWNYIDIKLRYFNLVLITIAVILSTSGNGIILMVVIYILFFINKLQGRHTILVIFAGIVFLIAGYIIYEKSEVIQYTVNAFSDNTDSDNSKTYYRIYRGFEVYGELPFYAQITGIGFRNAEHFLKTTNSQVYNKNKTGDVNFEYFNSIAAILIYFGIIGFILLFLFIRAIWRSTKLFGAKALLSVMMLSCISSSIFNSDTWFMYIILMAAMYHGILASDNYIKNESRLKHIA